MKAGSIIDGGTVRHLIDVNKGHELSTGKRVLFCSPHCRGGDLYYTHNINFESHLPPCKSCVAIHRVNRDRANKALAKLGVTP